MEILVLKKNKKGGKEVCPDKKDVFTPKNMTSTEFYNLRKENGLCVACGKVLDRKGTMCISCREKKTKESNEERKFYAENGICPRCHKNKLFGDEKVCLECKAYSTNKTLEKRKERKEEYNAYMRDYQKKEYNKRKEAGICTRCGKRKAESGNTTCGICRNKERESRLARNGEKNRSDRYLKGICFFCDNPIKHGYKVCEKHYKMNIEKANSSRAKEARKKLIKKENLY